MIIIVNDFFLFFDRYITGCSLMESSPILGEGCRFSLGKAFVNISWANRELFVALFAYVGESRIMKPPINKTPINFILNCSAYLLQTKGRFTQQNP